MARDTATLLIIQIDNNELVFENVVETITDDANYLMFVRGDNELIAIRHEYIAQFFLTKNPTNEVSD